MNPLKIFQKRRNADTGGKLAGRHVVIVIEGFPVPLFKILMQQATALRLQGAFVSIVSPKMFGLTKSHEIVDGIDIYRHPMPFEAVRRAGFLVEYAWAAACQLYLLIHIHLRQRIDVIEGCTPPDLVFIPALPFRMLCVKYMYCQFDLNPELYVSKYGRRDLFFALLLIFERLTYTMADAVIAPNESFRKIALGRGRVAPSKVTVIRCGPDVQQIKPESPDECFKNGRRFLVGYIGVVCKQDSLDLLMEIIRIVVVQRQDTHFAIIGDGPELPAVIETARRLQIADYITFFGMLHESARLCSIISTCDLCINPDRFDEFNDKITSIKIMEYMALKKPVVQFDLTEGRFTAQQASLYAENGNCSDFAGKIRYLLDHRQEREAMGAFGYQRIINELSWEHEQKKLVRMYEELFTS